MTEKTRKIILGGFLFMGLLVLLGWLHQTSLKEQKKDDYILYALFKKTDGVENEESMWKHSPKSWGM